MKSKIYHGELKLDETASALANFFNRGALVATANVDGNQAFVQIATRPGGGSGGRTQLAVAMRQADERLEVEVGDQSVFGLVGSLGTSAFLALLNPWNLLGRINDIAVDFENLTLEDQVWALLDRLAKNAGASQQLAARLQRMTCAYCGVANPVGEGRCIACGAPLGEVQPSTCPKCGYVLLQSEAKCPNCGFNLKINEARI